MAAVNFPAAVASPAIGLVFGGATGFLETQLAALETNGTGKINFCTQGRDYGGHQGCY